MNNTPQTDAAVEDTILHDRNHPRIDWVPASFGRELERERDEAREQQISACNSTLRLDAINFKLKKELDDAKTKIKSQANRLRVLEGATNHASGTPLKIALRQRDQAVADQENSRQSLAFALEELEEARNEILGWKNKWTCAIDMAARAGLGRP